MPSPLEVFRASAIALLLLLAGQALPCPAQTLAGLAAAPSIERPLPNLEATTLGGVQFWSDELVYGEWRIQRNVYTEHYRLLDDRDFRRAWGTFDYCRQRLEVLKRELHLPPLSARAVITLHGIIRSRNVMEGMAAYLLEEGGYTVLNVSYASTRRTLDEHAESLARVLDNLEGVDEVDFVCHSLGNLVLRRYLGEANAPEPRWKVDPRIGRIVMLAPPNQGAKLAEYFKGNKLVGLIWGPCCKQLAGEWPSLEKRLAVPRQEFAIIAGGRGNDGGVNPIIDGDDDLVLSIDETKLPGARDFAVAKVLHGKLMDDAAVRKATLNFLEHGYLVSEEARYPLARVPLQEAGGP